jgi:hypothetical protein
MMMMMIMIGSRDDSGFNVKKDSLTYLFSFTRGLVDLSSPTLVMALKVTELDHH